MRMILAGIMVLLGMIMAFGQPLSIQPFSNSWWALSAYPLIISGGILIIHTYLKCPTKQKAIKSN